MTSFTPQNELERLLVMVATDVGARPAFYRAFLDSTLLVIGNIPNAQVDGSGRGVVKWEDVQSIVQMQDPQGKFVIPVFSSFPRVKETNAGRVTCMQLKGKELLDLLGSEKPIVLNPMSEYSKEFTPGELAALQDGSMFKDPEHQTYPPDARVLPGLPAGYPEALVGALKSLFARYPGITRAYVGGIDSAGSASPPHAIVGINLTDNWFDIVPDAGLVAGELLGEGQYVDFLPLRQGDAISDYMLRNMEPFYGLSSEAPDHIDHYPPGVELDCLLAERVLGAKVSRNTEGWSGYVNHIAITPDGEEFYFELSPHSVYGPAPLWKPSTNLSDAQVLVRHLYMHSDYRSMTEVGTDEDGYSVTLWAYRPLDPTAMGVEPGSGPQPVQLHSVTGSAPTLALAVCRAAYKAARGTRSRQWSA